MNKQKISISILLLAVILVIIFVALKANKKATVDVDITKPVDVSTNGVETGALKPTEFGGVFVFKLNDKVTFSDGLNVTLKKINDSRCPKGVQCIWEGELSFNLELSNSSIVSKEIVIGTVRNKEVALEGYTFSLKDATENILTIQVVKN